MSTDASGGRARCGARDPSAWLVLAVVRRAGGAARALEAALRAGDQAREAGDEELRQQAEGLVAEPRGR